MHTHVPIFLISGTPGSGKSATATALMQRFPLGMHIPVDDLREWVVSGIAHPVPKWTEETARQFQLARQSATQIALLYANAGFVVAIDDVIFPNDGRTIYTPGLTNYPLYKILLLPQLAVALKRNAHRTNKSFETRVLVDTIHALRQALEEALPQFVADGWLVIDTTQLTLEQTVDEILRKTIGEREA